MIEDAYCKKHFITYCPDLSETCPYCKIAELEAQVNRVCDKTCENFVEPHSYCQRCGGKVDNG